MSSGRDTFLWVVVPYVCLTVFVVGHLWRYRYDKFGWTTRSSQLYENRLLRLGSPLFHFGILVRAARPRHGPRCPEVVDRRPSGSPRGSTTSWPSASAPSPASAPSWAWPS